MLVAALAAAGLSAAAPRALALDENTALSGPERSPWAVFRFGMSAYKQGHKEEAVEAYRYAAENGRIGARWKLARMYADGDGVARDEYAAFKFFEEIADRGVEVGDPEATYVADALVELGGYMRRGIEGTPVKPNLQAAQEYYMRAAANYAYPRAQYEIGKMFLAGEGVKKSVRLAARWLQLAAEKSFAPAQATLGHLLFQSGQTVRGLGMMTAALERAAPADRGWIRELQEEAFALSSEADRRTAIALSGDLLVGEQD